jgi:hypothetical protein
MRVNLVRLLRVMSSPAGWVWRCRSRLERGEVCYKGVFPFASFPPQICLDYLSKVPLELEPIYALP